MEKITPFLNKAKEVFLKINHTPDHTAEFDRADIESNKTVSIFSYISFLALIPLLAASKSRYARFHANQGLLLAIVELVCALVLRLLSKMALIGWIFAIVRWLAKIACTYLSLFGLWSVIQGTAKELPILGKYVGKK